VNTTGAYSHEPSARWMPVAAFGLDAAAVGTIALFEATPQFDTWLTVIAWTLCILTLLGGAVVLAVTASRRAANAGHGRPLVLTALAVSLLCLAGPAVLVAWFVVQAVFFPDSIGGG
jgi:heme/copper-type cytochrome/quinol oxidase subunit 2